MFTVEMDTDDGDSCTVVTLDNTGACPDVELIMYDDMVALRQITDDNTTPRVKVDMIVMTPLQWFDILHAMKLPEGVYYATEVDDA